MREGRRRDSPYQFLDYFEETDDVRFAGREQDVAEVVARATSARAFVLYGRSGLGKTSLLLAGVFPALRARGYLPVHVRILGDPLADVRAAIAAALPKGASADTDSVEDLLRLDSEPAGIILAIDQFEEFFIRFRQHPEARSAFIRALVQLLDATDIRVSIIFSLREDYLAEMDDFRLSYPEILGSAYRLRPLSAFGARQAIIAPLRAANIAFDERLVMRLVDLLADYEFDTVLLQVACNEVYEEASKRKDEAARLKEEDLDHIGGVDGLFRRYLEHAIEHVESGRRILSRAILDALITTEQTKRTVTVEELLTNEDFQASQEEVESVLRALEDQRLLRLEPRLGKDWYELTHDRLVPAIVDWFKSDPDFAKFRSARDRVTTSAREEFRGQLEMLLSASQFQAVHSYRLRLRLTASQKELMLWSAVYLGVASAELDYWVTACGTDQLSAVITTLLRHEQAEARENAAKALAAFCARCGGLAPQCLAAALDDTDENVRRAAGKALAGLAGADERAIITERLWSRRSRPAALEILADLAETGAPLSGFARGWRVLGYRRWRRRAMGLHRDTINWRAKRGAVVGLLVGFAWAITAGAAALSGAMWAEVELNWSGLLFNILPYLIIGAALFGSLAGWRWGRSAARRAAITREGRWFRSITRVWAPLAVAVLATPLAILSQGLGPDWQWAAFAVPVTAALILLTGVAVWAMRPAVWPTATRWSVLFLGLAVAFVPLTLALLLLLALAALGHQADSDLAAVIVMPASLLGFLASVAFTTLSDGAQRHPIGERTPIRPGLRRAARLVAIVLAVGAVPLYIALVGTDHVPIWRFAQAVSDIQPMFLPGDAATRYVKVSNSGTSARWLKLTGLPVGAEFHLRGDDPTSMPPKEPGDILLRMEPGIHLGKAQAGTGSDSARVTLEPVDEFVSKNLVLSTTERKPFLLRLKKEPGQSGDTSARWTQTWNLQLPVEAPKDSSLTILFPASSNDESKVQGILKQTSRRSDAPFDFDIPVATRTVVFDRNAVSTTSRQATTELPVSLNDDGSFSLGLIVEVDKKSPGETASELLKSDEMVIPVFVALSKDAGRHYAEARELLWNEHVEEALPEFEEAARLDPENPEYLNSLAWTHIVIARAKKKSTVENRTLELSRTAVRAKPDDPLLLDTLGHAAYMTGNWREAVEAWDKAFKLKPNYYKDDDLCADDRASLETARTKYKGEYKDSK